MLQADAFLALAAYRMKARLLALGIPVLPWIAHRLAMVSAQISIADAALVHPGVFIPGGLAMLVPPALTANYVGRYMVPMAGPMMARRR